MSKCNVVNFQCRLSAIQGSVRVRHYGNLTTLILTLLGLSFQQSFKVNHINAKLIDKKYVGSIVCKIKKFMVFTERDSLTISSKTIITLFRGTTFYKTLKVYKH